MVTWFENNKWEVMVKSTKIGQIKFHLIGRNFFDSDTQLQ